MLFSLEKIIYEILKVLNVHVLNTQIAKFSYGTTFFMTVYMYTANRLYLLKDILKKTYIFMHQTIVNNLKNILIKSFKNISLFLINENCTLSVDFN